MKSKILHIIPYESWIPPKGGGYLRIYYTLLGLAKSNYVDVVSFADEDLIENCQDYKFPRERAKHIHIKKFESNISNNWLDQYYVKLKRKLINIYLTKSIFTPVNSKLVDIYLTLTRRLQKNTYNYIILESINLFQFIPFLRKNFSQCKIIYNCHNIYFELNEEDKKGKLFSIEKDISKIVDYVWVCSKSDLNKLKEINDNGFRGHVVPNGVDITRNIFLNRRTYRGYKNLLFVGTLSYEPNIDGLFWFTKYVLPAIAEKYPDVRLIVVGKGWSDRLDVLKINTSIEIVGEVDDLTKYYHNSFISIVPLFSGSGTRLKILEAMSFGTIVVSTTKGIEGIDALNGEHAFIANSVEEFVVQITNLFENPERTAEVVQRAKKLVDEKYDWDIVTKNLLTYVK